MPVPDAQDLLKALGLFLAGLFGAAAGSIARPRSQDPEQEVQWVVRGGVTSAENLQRVANNGNLTILGNLVFDMSVETAPNAPVPVLASYLPHNQIGVTSYDRVRREGGKIFPDPRYEQGVLVDPFHALLSNLSVDQTVRLFSPPKSNLWKNQRLYP